MDEKVACRTPTKGRDGVTNIPKWKFALLRTAILDAVGAQGLEFSHLQDAVRSRISDADLDKLGSLGWHVTSVKLEMEVRGEIERVPGTKPQRLKLGKGQNLR